MSIRHICICTETEQEFQPFHGCPAHNAAKEAAAEPAPPTDGLRDALRIHHPIMRSETGPFSGCRCGQVRLGEDVIAHVVAELRRALDGDR